jgi:hypothetical protein
MKIVSLFFSALLLLTAAAVRAQRAYPIKVDSLLSIVPIPHSSVACYDACTKTTDPSTGIVSIKDNGAAFQSLQYLFDKITKAAISDASNTRMASMSTTPPSADQIEQMKQQAMAQASQAQGMNAQQMAQMHNNSGASRLSSEDVQLMKLINEAQITAGKLSQLTNELSAKVGALDHSAIDTVSMGGNCPEVMQGGYAGPTCGCMTKRATTYESKRVTARNALVPKVSALLSEYVGKLHPLIVTLDNVVIKAKYGDAVSNPAYRQQVVNIQREALSAVASLDGIASHNWEDAAKQYAGLVNAESGASVGCYGRK